MKGKKLYIIIIFLMSYMSVYSQYQISGYIKTEEKSKTVYLSLLRFNEENTIYPNQVLTSTQVDSTGYFEISGKLLSDENKLYRIHSNIREKGELLEFVESGENKNYHHFIFSNNDTIYFPRGEVIWFSNPHNTNAEDKQWRGAIDFELELLTEYSKAKNNEGIIQAERKYLSEYQQYASDSLIGSLAKLMVFAHLGKEIDLTLDFVSNPKFYNELLEELNKDYSGISYYSQYEAELSKLSASLYKEKYTFHKLLNSVLAATIICLLVIIGYFIRKLKDNKRKKGNVELSMLTPQEEKVTKLICEGKSNKEIASELFISLSTIKSHIGNINSKLSVTSRKQLTEKLKNHPGY